MAKKFPGSYSSILLLPILAVLIACSFDYGDAGDDESRRADIVMEDITYVRVRGGDPLARFHAEYAERWEERQIMELEDFTFEQLEDMGETINAAGSASRAIVQLNTGDIDLYDGVIISIESEEITISTSRLGWRDESRILYGGVDEEVDIERLDGTNFRGIGFSADIRNRTFAFSGEVEGTYIDEDEDEDEPEDEEPHDDGPAIGSDNGDSP